MKASIFLVIASLVSFKVMADVPQLPQYSSPEIIARTNLNDTYSMPEMSFIVNPQPALNNRGDVVFKVLSADGQTAAGVWMKRFDDQKGKIYYQAESEMIISDPSLNQAGVTTFAVSDMAGTEGVFTFDLNTDALTKVIKPNKNIQFYTYPKLIGKDIYFRITDKENNRAFIRYDGKMNTIAEEGSSINSKSTSYLFKPSINEKGDMVYKRRIGKVGEWAERNADEILLMKNSSTGRETISIAQDVDMDVTSVYKSFTNTVGLSENGDVAFISDIVTGGRGVFLVKAGKHTLIANDKDSDVSEIEMFEPKVNSNAQVVFRAKDSRGLRSIFIGDGTRLVKLISEGDVINTDRGEAKILQNTLYPGFTGGVDFNDKGQILFSVLLVDKKTNKEWGTGVFLLSPKK